MKSNLPYNVMRYKSWDSAPRVEVIAAYLFPSAMAAGGSAAFLATAAVYIGVSAVTSWAISALSPKPDFSSSSSQGNLVNSRDATAPVDFVYGQVRKGGTVSYYESTGAKNKFLHQIIVLAGHEVQQIGDIYINDNVVNINASDFVNDITWAEKVETSVPAVDGGFSEGGEEYKSKIRIQKFNGSQTSAPADLLDESELTGSDALTSDFVGNDIAYLYVRYEYDGEVFASGVPLITSLVQGKNVYDPRTSTTAYSNNAALCIRDFIESTYGLNDSAIDDVSFSAAANESDEDVRLSNVVDAINFVIGQQYEIKTVGTTDFTQIGASANTVGQVFVATGSGSGTGDAYRSEKRYKINGIVNASSPTGKVLGDMSTACAGTLFWGSGYWKLKVGAYTSPVKTLTLDDLRGPIKLQTRSSTRDSFNGVGGTFNNAEGDFITADYPPIKSSTFQVEDGGDEMLLDLSLPFTTSASAAQRIAKMTLYRGREQMTITADFGLEAFNIEVGDIISFDNDRYWSDPKEFEVIGWRFGPEQSAGDLRVSLTLQETSAAAFSWSAEEGDIIDNNTNLPEVGAGLAITNLTASGGGKTQKDGTFIAATILSWTAVTNAFVSYYEIEWKPTADSNYSSTTTTQSSIELSPIIDDVEYTFRVRAVTTIGNSGPIASVTFTAGGDVTAPSLPTSISAVGGFEYITVKWTNPNNADFNYVEVWENTSNTTTGATKVGTSAGDEFVRTNLGASQTKWYFLKSVDYSGNKSAFTSGASGTTTFITDSDFENGVYSLFTDAGLYAIRDVTSLPASGSFTGEKVFNRTDNKLYQWAGSAWELVVAEPDTFIASDKIVANTITGGLLSTSGIITSSAQIDDALITNAKIDNLAVSTIKIQDQSVSVFRSAVQNGGLSTLTSDWVYGDVVSLTFTPQDARELNIWVSGNHQYSSASQYIGIRVRLWWGGTEGTLVYSQELESSSNDIDLHFPILALLASPANAENTLTAQIGRKIISGSGGASSSSQASWTMVVGEVKK